VPDVNLHPVHDTATLPPEPGIALCLSGGGYRAMLFHAGCLWRLNELGLLGGLSRISSVSGGSITSGVLGMNWRELGFAAGSPSSRFAELVVTPLRQMASTTIDEGAPCAAITIHRCPLRAPSRIRTRRCEVRRTPWSARVPLDPHSGLRGRTSRPAKAGWRAAADGRSRVGKLAGLQATQM
jgi:hypothetical protein